MAHHVTLHLHNVPENRLGEYAAWFEGPHREALARLRGFKGAERYEVTPEQVMPDIAQPWRFVSIYEFDFAAPEIDIPALGPLLADARDAGLIDDRDGSERVVTYAMYSDWVASANHHPDKPLSHVSLILANITPGRDTEYHAWYDDVHCPEVTISPGFVAMKRGKQTTLQIEPRRFVYGGELVFCGQQTDDIGFTIKDFAERARGTSISGIAFAPRSKSGSFARTVHFFRKISGTKFWSGGIAYSGDMTPYGR
ncbi:MAG TPA: hypothetical protein VGE05_06405 [Novosphingobium sp.]